MSEKVHKGIVKQVLSGDTIVLRGKPVSGPPPEKTVSFAHISAPRVAKRPNVDTSSTATAAAAAAAAAATTTSTASSSTTSNASENDEPFGWQSREFLRSRLVGKEVSFVVQYTVNSGREFGTVFLNNENITKLLLAEGLAKVRPLSNANQKTEEYDELVRIETEAQASAKGVWSVKEGENKHVRQITWKVENQRALIDQNHGKQIDALVEQVRDGSTLRLFLLPQFIYVTVQLSGVKAPSFKRAEGSDKEVAEEFAEEAKFFVESRLLQREVKVILEGVSNQNAFVGSVLHPAGSIAEALLSEGLAKCVDWSMGMVTSGRDKYRANEKAAKQRKVRLWKNYAAPASGLASSSGSGSGSTSGDITGKEFSAKVVEIVNAETFVVKVLPGEEVMKISLASIRQPKPESKKDESSGSAAAPAAKATMFDVPFGFDAREFLRKKLLNHKVKFVVDYVKPASDGFPAKTCVTLKADEVNIGEALVSKGYVTVIRHRNDDDQRSSTYDDLLAAETQAQKGLKGIHGKKEGGTHRVNDISTDSSVAKQFFPFLQRAGRLSATVEYIGSGSRVKVYIPRETCLATFLLSGISCPRSSRGPNEPGQPFGDEASAFTRSRLLQHDVEIVAEALDKTGGVIGALYLPEGNENFAVTLVEEGFASVHSSAERLPYSRDLINAEQRAKNARRRIWKDYKEEAKPTPEELAAQDDTSERKLEFTDVAVTEVSSANALWVQKVSEGGRLEEVMDAIAAYFATHPPLAGAYTPKVGDICAAKFTADDAWYRGRVVRSEGGSKYNVLYVDYGNSESLPSTRLASLPSQFASLPAFAQEVQLAFVTVPTDAEWALAAADFVKDAVLSKQLLMNVEYKKDGKPCVSIVDPETKADLSIELLSEGLASVERRRESRLATLVANAVKAQDDAKANHLNMWRYGDFTSDDAREFGYTGKKPVKN